MGNKKSLKKTTLNGKDLDSSLEKHESNYNSQRYSRCHFLVYLLYLKVSAVLWHWFVIP